MVNRYVADIFHIKSVGLLGMLKPAVAVKLNHPIVVGANP